MSEGRERSGKDECRVRAKCMSIRKRFKLCNFHLKTMSMTRLVESYQKVTNMIADSKKKLTDLKKEEKRIHEEFIKYLQETGEEGIKIDGDTVINLRDVDKKIIISPPKYKQKIKALLISKGVYVDGIEDEIIKAKIGGQVHEQKLKINRKK